MNQLHFDPKDGIIIYLEREKRPLQILTPYEVFGTNPHFVAKDTTDDSGWRYFYFHDGIDINFIRAWKSPNKNFLLTMGEGWFFIGKEIILDSICIK